MHGREAARRAPTLIREDRTQRGELLRFFLEHSLPQQPG
jgi:hypothetical protein